MFNSEKFYRKLNTYRKAVQMFSLLFLILIPVLILLDIRYVIGNLYSISFWDLDIVDPAMMIQTIVLSKEFYLPLFIAALIPIILAAAFGRVFCSWMCPYNTLMELLEIRWLKNIQRKIFNRKRRKNVNPPPYVYWVVYVSALSMVLILGIPLLTWISMPGLISSEIFAAISGLGLGVSAVIFAVIFLAELILGKRYWCKYICPIGATLSLFRTKYSMQIIHDDSVCDCAAFAEPCASSCPFELNPKENNIYPYCFNCGRCIKICEISGNRALTFAFINNKIKRS